MASDMKYEIMERAWGISIQRYSVDFYDLPTDKQDAVYREATETWTDAMASRADYLNDRKGELQ
jgi:hypothetical protein